MSDACYNMGIIGSMSRRDIMKRVIVSGYFNPLSAGHVDMIESARQLGDYLIAIINNDKQLMLRKGRVELSETDRQRVMGAMKHIDEVILSIDEQLSVEHTLELIAKRYPEDKLIFVNGGSRDSEEDVPERAICHKYNIDLVFDN